MALYMSVHVNNTTTINSDALAQLGITTALAIGTYPSKATTNVSPEWVQERTSGIIPRWTRRPGSWPGSLRRRKTS